MARAWRLRTRRLNLDHPVMVGIVNVTPDSFSDGGQFVAAEAAVAQGRSLAAAGATLIDVGGESTRPGAEPVEAGLELDRVLPVVEGLCADGIAVSIDTTKPEVAEAAIRAGAEAVNDVSGLVDAEMRKVCAAAGVGVVIMHMQGDPRTMQLEPRYEDVVGEVSGFLRDRAQVAEQDGVLPEAICVDPGIGFGKDLNHNLELLDRLDVICRLGYPVMIGTSRKSFLGRLTGADEPARRDLATAVTVAMAVDRGARLARVHNVAMTREAALVAEAIVASRRQSS